MDPLALRSLIESTTPCTVDPYRRTYAGIATFFRTKYEPGLSATDIALTGLPVGAGLTQRTGARHGPREVQSCNIFETPCLSAGAFTPRAEVARL